MKDFGWVPIIVILVVVAISALYSMAETAMMALSRGKVRNLVEQGEKGAKRLERVIREPNLLLGTVLVGNNLANIVASSLAAAFFIHLYGARGAVISAAVMTVFILIAAEITPKTYAAHNAERVALKLTVFLAISSRLFGPVVHLLTWLGSRMIRLFGGNAEGGRILTEEEIRHLVEVGEEEGLLHRGERDMIQGIFDLGDTVVREVMVPRIDVRGLPETALLSDAWDALIQWGHSRLPVFRETIDDVVGVLYARDVLAYVKEKPPDTPVRELARPIHYVPETKKVDGLLTDFRRQRSHIAVVLDEYGGTAGIVTIEDLLEEIVGEIQDEYDMEDQPVRDMGDGQLDVAGLVSLDEINDRLDVELPHEDFDTVGGLMLHLLGRVPVEGDVVTLDGVEFTVSKVIGRRVTRVIIRLLTRSMEEDD